MIRYCRKSSETLMSLMSSGRADKIGNVLHRASIIVLDIMRAWHGSICTKHIQSKDRIVREGFHCFVQIRCEIWATKGLDWLCQLVGGVGALLGSKPCLRGKDQAGGEQYVPQPALGVILDCDLPPQALSSLTVSLNVYASVLPWNTTEWPAADSLSFFLQVFP